MDYFYLDDTPTMPDYYIIRLNHDKLKCKSTLGSYQILEARLLNISFANFLRLCRDSFGAEIYGKNCFYPIPYFKNYTAAQELITLLNENAAAALIISENK